MPLTKYKLHKKSLHDSINLNLSSSTAIELQPTIPENNRKRQRVESIEQNIPSESTITIITPAEKEPRQKKTKSIEHQVVQPPVIQPTSEPPIVQPTLQEPITEKEITSDLPLSLPSKNGRIRELKSKTPTWKAQQPVAKGNTQGNVYHSLYSLNINRSRQITYSIRFG